MIIIAYKAKKKGVLTEHLDTLITDCISIAI